MEKKTYKKHRGKKVINKYYDRNNPSVYARELGIEGCVELFLSHWKNYDKDVCLLDREDNVVLFYDNGKKNKKWIKRVVGDFLYHNGFAYQLKNREDWTIERIERKDIKNFDNLKFKLWAFMTNGDKLEELRRILDSEDGDMDLYEELMEEWNIDDYTILNDETQFNFLIENWYND